MDEHDFTNNDVPAEREMAPGDGYLYRVLAQGFHKLTGIIILQR